MGWIEEEKMGKKSGDTVPSRYLDSKFKKVAQEISTTGTLHIQELVSAKFLQVSCCLPSASPGSDLYACQHAIADSQRLTEVQQPSEHFVCGSAGCRELLFLYIYNDQCWAAILKNVSFKAIQIHNF